MSTASSSRIRSLRSCRAGAGCSPAPAPRRRRRCRIPRTAAMRCPRRRMACCGSIPGPARFRPAAIRGAGWACYAVPDERAALDAEIGRLQADNEKLKKELASREPTVAGKIEEPMPKSDSLKKSEPRTTQDRRGRTQDRNPAAERSRHGSHDVVPGAGLAAVDRDGQPGAEGRQRQDLTSVVPARDFVRVRAKVSTPTARSEAGRMVAFPTTK